MIIKIHHSDNVAIVADAGGLPSGHRFEDGLTLVDDVPQGHKVALVNFGKGDPIIRYGETIGYAAQPVVRGRWVSEDLVDMPQAHPLEKIPLALRSIPPMEPLDGYTFEGYRNADGTVGTKNILGITTSVQCVAPVANQVARRIKEELLPRYPNVDDVVALTHAYGCGVAINAPAAVVPIRTLQNLVRNPNLGGEVLVLGLGCEKLEPERLLPPGAQCENGCIVEMQDEKFRGYSAMVEGIMAMAEKKLARLNERRRESCPASDLVVGLQCGGSDALSGLTATPAVGFAAAPIVRAGGTAVFSEVSEVRDAIHLLVPRAADRSVAKALVREMEWYDRYLEMGGVDRSANTTPGNKEGGLSNIVEKALGSVIKSGSGSIAEVVGPGNRIEKKGLIFAATPASDFVCGTLQLAAGINLQVFTTGRGTPYGLAMAPVIKVSSRSVLSDRWYDLIDLDAGRIATGEASIEETGWELFHLILEVASGRVEAAADRLGLHNDLVLFNPAPIT